MLSGSYGYDYPPEYYDAIAAQQAAAEAANGQTYADVTTGNYSVDQYVEDYTSIYGSSSGGGDGNGSSGYGSGYYNPPGPPPVDAFTLALQEAFDEAEASYTAQMNASR